MFSFNFAPKSWALCNGALMQISQNQALNALISGLYTGGDGRTTFALPDLRGRTPKGMGVSPVTGNTYQQGKFGGSETVALTVSQIPLHTHAFVATTNDGDKTTSLGNIITDTKKSKAGSDEPTYVADSAGALQAMNPNMVVSAGGGTAHSNLQPSLVLNFCIATTGIFPPRD